MEGTDLIIEALAAGAASGTAASVKDAASNTVTRAYQGLKSALRRAFASSRARPAENTDVLADYERDRQPGEKNLREAIVATEAYLSDEVISAALQLLRAAGAEKRTSNEPGKTWLQVVDSQGVQLITDQVAGEQYNDFRK